MRDLETVFLLAIGVALQVGCVRLGRLEWREPLRERSPVDARLLTRSVFGGIASTTVMHARLRAAPTGMVAAFFLLLGAELELLGVHSDVAVYIPYAIGIAAGVVCLLVVLFNAPRWAVPPEVREASGMIELRRRLRRPAEPR